MLKKKYEEGLELFYVRKDSTFFKKKNNNNTYDLMSCNRDVPVLMNWDGVITKDLINQCDEYLDEIYEDDGFFESEDWYSALENYILCEDNRLIVLLKPRVSYGYGDSYRSYMQDEVEKFYIDIPRNKTISLYDLLCDAPIKLNERMKDICNEEEYLEKEYGKHMRL